MKNKFKLALVSIISLIVITSFYYLAGNQQTHQTPTYYKSFPGTVAFCAAVFNPADSAADIPALRGWGKYNWKISTISDSAQYYFNQGLSMYYAFHTIEAVASFAKATRFDPDCAMGWYGMALAYGPNINFSNSYRAPKEALTATAKSKELMVKCTPLEKELIMAIQHRYTSDTTVSLAQLRQNYADAMKLVYNRYPENVDAVTLYADALLLLHPWDLYTQDNQPKAWTPEIRSVLEKALTLAPSHPGANHYYIHTMEASSSPDAALNSANVLDTLMPQVSHITHMPSHIYIRTGDFKRGLKVNDDAVAGYEQYLKAYAPVINGFGLYKVHNIHLKSSCAQMAGNYKIAKESADTVQYLIPPDYLAMKNGDGNYMQELYAQPIINAVRFGKWDAILSAPIPDTLPYVSALQHFSRGVAYSRQQNPKKAKLELSTLESKMKDETLKLNLDNFSSPYRVLGVARLILKGVIAEDQKQHRLAVNFYQQAVTAEDQLIYIEPRAWLLPARQYLANALLKSGLNGQAIKVFKADLKINPKNAWSLTGLHQAYLKTGNQRTLTAVQLKLDSALAMKDVMIKKAVF